MVCKIDRVAANEVCKTADVLIVKVVNRGEVDVASHNQH